MTAGNGPGSAGLSKRPGNWISSSLYCTGTETASKACMVPTKERTESEPARPTSLPIACHVQTPSNFSPFDAMQNFRKDVLNGPRRDMKSFKAGSVRPCDAIAFHQFNLTSGNRRARQKFREAAQGMPERERSWHQKRSIARCAGECSQ